MVFSLCCVRSHLLVICSVPGNAHFDHLVKVLSIRFPIFDVTLKAILFCALK